MSNSSDFCRICDDALSSLCDACEHTNQDRAYEAGYAAAIKDAVALCEKRVEQAEARLRGDVGTFLAKERLECFVSDIGDMADEIEILRPSQTNGE